MDRIDDQRCPYCNGGEKARAEVHYRNSLKRIKVPIKSRGESTEQLKKRKRLRKLREESAQVTETPASPKKKAKKRRRVDKLAPHNASPSGKKAAGSKRS